MVAIGRALMSQPETILLDEPSMGLAPQLVEEIFEIVKQLNEKESVAFLLAEQNTNVALKYAHKGYILESGRVVMDGPAKELRENPDVKEFYLGMSEEGRSSFKNNDLSDKLIQRNDLSLDPDRHLCKWKGEEIRLTVTEFLILYSLAQRPGLVKNRDQLIDTAYGETIYVDDRTIDSHIKRMRRKFRVFDKKFDHIETLYGVGYRFRDT